MLKKVTVLVVVLGVAFGLMLLTTGESHFEISRSTTLPEPQAQVWQALVSVDSWPEWWPGMERSRLNGELVPGNKISLQLKGMPTADTAIVSEVDIYKRLAWEGAGVLGSLARTSFVLAGESTGSRLTITNSIRGPQAFLARITGEDAFLDYQQSLLQSLGLYLRKREASSGEKD